MAAEAQQALKQFEHDLVPGNPLNDKAEELFRGWLEAGYPDTPVTRGAAVLATAAIMGKSTAQTSDRSTLVQTLNKAVKETVAAGAGAATTSAPATTDWLKASKDDYQRKLRAVQGLD